MTHIALHDPVTDHQHFLLAVLNHTGEFTEHFQSVCFLYILYFSGIILFLLKTSLPIFRRFWDFSGIHGFSGYPLVALVCLQASLSLLPGFSLMSKQWIHYRSTDYTASRKKVFLQVVCPDIVQLIQWFSSFNRHLFLLKKFCCWYLKLRSLLLCWRC